MARSSLRIPMLRICCLISSFATICFEPWSIPYASDIRRGRRRSHPRHWKVLAELVSIASRDLEVKCDNEFPWLQIGNNLEPFKISQNSAFKRGSAMSVQVRIGVRSGGMDVLPSLPSTPSNGVRGAVGLPVRSGVGRLRSRFGFSFSIEGPYVPALSFPV